MSGTLDAALVFAFLSFFHFWGGGAVGAGAVGGASGRGRIMPVIWGLLIGGAPLYFGIERGVKLGEWGWLAFQVALLLVSAVLVAVRLPRLRALFLTEGMVTLTIGTLIMAAGAVVGAWLFRLGSEFWSLAAGGIGFMFGTMWFGAGIKQLRGK